MFLSSKEIVLWTNKHIFIISYGNVQWQSSNVAQVPDTVVMLLLIGEALILKTENGAAI